MLEHGGNLHVAKKYFNIPMEAWLDLSTGLNPHSYPIVSEDTNATLWHRLPHLDETFLVAASNYYENKTLLPVAGSQAAIQALARIRPASRVVVSYPSYAEHAYQWRSVGIHQVNEVIFADLNDHVANADVVVVCSPNNPTGERIPPETLISWSHELAQRNGWLIVDEAFIDLTPHESLTRLDQVPGLIVLRSFGKFFGLAGVRLGCVFAPSTILTALQTHLGPWTISLPSQHIARRALADEAWQASTRTRLRIEGDRLRNLLMRHGMQSSGCDLFQWISDENLDHESEALWTHFAQAGIWTRLFRNDAKGVRIGLPKSDRDWSQLEHSLAHWTQIFTKH